MGEEDHFSQILNFHYDGIKDSRIIPTILQVIGESRSINDLISRGLSIEEIKRVTKIFGHIVYSARLNSIDSQVLDGFEVDSTLLEKVYNYNKDLAESLEASFSGSAKRLIPRDKKSPENNDERMGSHFMGHAASIARKLFELGNNPEWAIKWYECNINAAKMGKNADPKYSVHSYKSAGMAAMKLFNLTEKIDWALKAYEALLFSANSSISLSIRNSSYSYSEAAEAAKVIFYKTNEMEWLGLWLSQSLLAANLSKNVDAKHSAFAYRSAGDAASCFFIHLKTREWGQKAISFYEEFLEYFKKKRERGSFNERFGRYSRPDPVNEVETMIYRIERASKR